MTNPLKEHKMYILASDFFEKDYKYVFKLEIRVRCSEFLAFKYVFLFFRNRSDDYLYLYMRNLKNSLFGTQYPFLFVLDGTKWILCCRKMVVLNVQYLRFLKYKISFKIAL